MNTITISTTSPEAIQRAITILLSGGLVAFPTDTVYGLAALVSDPAGIDRIYAAKGRDTAKALPILIGDINDLPRITPPLPKPARALAEHFWPGALTLVIPKAPGLPENLSNLPTVGVRMPDFPFTLALLRRTGPLAVTSANLSGKANPRSAAEVLAQLGGRIELILDGGTVPGGVPSTVVDCSGAQIKILRQGAISADEIRKIVPLG